MVPANVPPIRIDHSGKKIKRAGPKIDPNITAVLIDLLFIAPTGEFPHNAMRLPERHALGD